MQRKKVPKLLAVMAVLGLVAGQVLTAGAEESSEAAAVQEESMESVSPDAAQEESTESVRLNAGQKEGMESVGSDSASGKSEDTEEVELTVFAAASMTETLTEISDLYKAAAPNVSLVFNFDSSGTLKTQIEEGAACDLFISAGQLQMNQLDITADPEINTDGLDFVQEDSRIDLLENKVTLCVSEDNPQGIETFDDWAKALEDGTILMAMGNSDVPVGQYTQKILEYYGLSEEELAANGVISYGTNVKEVTTQITEGSVDCGVIYCTDAFSAGLTVQDYATAEMCGQVIYPAAVMKNSAHPAEAQAFLDYLLTDESMAVFENVGFSPVVQADEEGTAEAETEGDTE